MYRICAVNTLTKKEGKKKPRMFFLLSLFLFRGKKENAPISESKKIAHNLDLMGNGYHIFAFIPKL